mgnify:CR=1 FL=1
MPQPQLVAVVVLAAGLAAAAGLGAGQPAGSLPSAPGLQLVAGLAAVVAAGLAAVLAGFVAAVVGGLGNGLGAVLGGLLVVGKTIADAFLSMYTFEATCQIQIAAQSSGARLAMPSESLAKRTAMQTKNGTPMFQQPGRDDFDQTPTDKLLGFLRPPYAGHQNSQHFNP